MKEEWSVQSNGKDLIVRNNTILKGSYFEFKYIPTSDELESKIEELKQLILNHNK